MQKPVPNGGLVNVARLGIVNPERLIRSVLVNLIKELAVQG